MVSISKQAGFLALAQQMAQSGKFKDCVAIEAALIIRGEGEFINLLNEQALRAELDRLCNEAQHKQPRRS